ELKPSRFALEEDEGFSDWSHRLENRHETEEQKTQQEEEDDEQEVKTILQMQQQTSADEEAQEEEEERSSTGENWREIQIRKQQTHRPAEEEDEEYHEIKEELHLLNRNGFDETNFKQPNFISLTKSFSEFVCSPTVSEVFPQITERTESLRRSTSNIKKTSPPLSVSKIDKRLEEYTHALEISSKEGRSSCQALTELTGPAEPVASKKNLFEAGDAWNQNVASAAASKEIRPGGVLNKKNLWESLGDTLSSTRDGKENSTKRYKYVVTGHGKYAKVSGNDCSEDVSCQAGEKFP
uniref:Lymphocyte specific protein 1 b n=1 Tax=Poecilia formosa TaxID=48698 RepID=A0A096MAP5_POEFO